MEDLSPAERLDALLADLDQLTVTTSEAAALRGVKPSSIAQASWRGALAPINLSRETRYLRADIVGDNR